MADRPIIFSGAMVRALLDGCKTQTRRLLSPQPETFPVDGAECQVEAVHVQGEAVPRIATGRVLTAQKLPFAAGDRAYVREAWHAARSLDAVAPRDLPRDADIEPSATARNYAEIGLKGRLRPGMHMPRWASRLTLFVEDVGVQRLQDISEADALAEGVVWQEATDADRQWAREYAAENGGPVEIDGVWTVPGVAGGAKADVWGCTPQMAYHMLWNSLHAEPGTRWEDNPWIYALTFRVAHGNIDQLEQAA